MAVVKEGVTVRLGLDKTEFDRGLENAQKGVSGFAKRINDIFSNISFGAFGGVLGAGAVGSGLMSIVNSISGLNREAKNLGMTVDQLQAFQHAARIVGRDADFAGEKLGKLSEQFGGALGGDGGLIEKFSKYGVALYNASGGARSLYDTLGDLADRIKSTQNQNLRGAILEQFFGKGGDELIAPMSQGREGLELMRGKAAISQSTASAVDMAKNSLLSGWHQLVSALMTPFKDPSQEPKLESSVDSQGRFAWIPIKDRSIPPADMSIQQALTEKRDKSAFERATYAERVMILEREIADLQATTDKISDNQPVKQQLLVKIKERQVELAKTEVEYKKQAQESEDKQAAATDRLVKLQQQLADLQRNRAMSADDLYRAKLQPSKFTEDEIAAGGFIPGNAWHNYQVAGAQRAKMLLRLSRYSESIGNQYMAEQAIGERYRILQSLPSLRDSERAPFAQMERGIQSMDANVAKLAQEVTKLGGVVTDPGQ